MSAPAFASAPSTTRPVRRFAAELVLCAVGFAALTLVLAALYDGAGPALRVGLAFVAAAGLVGIYALVVRVVEHRRATEVGAGRIHMAVAGVAIGAALVALTVGIVAGLGSYRVVERMPLGLLVPRVAPSLHSAVWEELMFRGVLFRWMAHGLGTGKALAGSAAIFGALHGLVDNGSTWSAVAIALEAGVLLSLAYWVTNDLWLPIGMHFGWNLTLGGVFGSAVSGGEVAGVLRSQVTGSDWLTGGTFGLEASVPAVLVCGTASLLIWQFGLSRRR